MAAKRTHRKIERSPKELSRLKQQREHFQREHPSLEELVESGDYIEPTSQQAYLATKAIAHQLKQARQKAGLSLADVAAATGLDRSAVSRLENGIYSNPTIHTLTRLASAYHLRLAFHLEQEEGIPGTSPGREESV